MGDMRPGLPLAVVVVVEGLQGEDQGGVGLRLGQLGRLLAEPLPAPGFDGLLQQNKIGDDGRVNHADGLHRALVAGHRCQLPVAFVHDQATVYDLAGRVYDA